MRQNQCGRGRDTAAAGHGAGDGCAGGGPSFAEARARVDEGLIRMVTHRHMTAARPPRTQRHLRPHHPHATTHRVNDMFNRATACFVSMQIIVLLKISHTKLGGSELPEIYAGGACSRYYNSTKPKLTTDHTMVKMGQTLHMEG